MTLFTRCINKPHAPIATLLFLACFAGIGCGVPYYRYDANTYLNSPRLHVPTDRLDDATVYVTPLGIRRARETGDLRLDVLLAGRNAFDVAIEWIDAPRRGGQANAVLSLRRVTPDAQPISLRFAKDAAIGTPLTDTGEELHRGLSRGDQRIMLTFALDTTPSWRPGLYEILLQVPEGSLSTPWNVGNTAIIIDQDPMRIQVGETTRLEAETHYAMP